MGLITKPVSYFIGNYPRIRNAYLLAVDNMYKRPDIESMSEREFGAAIFASIASSMNGKLIYPDGNDCDFDACPVYSSTCLIEVNESDLILFLLGSE